MQTLVSLFLDAFIFTANTKKDLQKGLQPSVSEMQETLKSMFVEFDELNTNSSSVGSQIYSDDIYKSAKFAIAVYIDEMLVSSAWSFSSDWMHNSLQKDMFDTISGGKEFFDKLEEVSGLGTKEERDLAELFSYCIALGFRGAYYDNQEKLNFIMRSLYSKIVKHDDSYSLYRQELPVAESFNEVSGFRISGKALAIIYVSVVTFSTISILWLLGSELSDALSFFTNLY